jgi:hypothetical protein
LNAGGLEQHLYFIKVMRIFKCSEVFDVRKFMIIYKNYSKARVDRIIKNDPTQAEDIETDVVHITIQIMIGKVF